MKEENSQQQLYDTTSHMAMACSHAGIMETNFEDSSTYSELETTFPNVDYDKLGGKKLLQCHLSKSSLPISQYSTINYEEKWKKRGAKTGINL